MKYFIVSILILLAGCAGQVDSEQEKEKLGQLLNEFLQGASVGDAAMHDRFWADDLIYTGSAGTRTTKADIMASLQAESDSDDGPDIRYHAEDVRIQVYGSAAVVAFRLVGVTDDERLDYLNTGTFLKRNGQWQAVAWQATRASD